RPRIADQQGSALAIGSPVRGDRRAGGQQLLEHHVTLQLRALVASEAARPRHADPAALTELATERRIGGAPVARTRGGRVARKRLGEELAHLDAQSLAAGVRHAGLDAGALRGVADVVVVEPAFGHRYLFTIGSCGIHSRPKRERRAPTFWGPPQCHRPLLQWERSGLTPCGRVA